jgi:hypothetical protein
MGKQPDSLLNLSCTVQDCCCVQEEEAAAVGTLLRSSCPRLQVLRIEGKESGRMIVLPSFFVALSALDHGGYLQELHINKALPAPVELVQSISTLSVLALTLVLPFAHQGLHVAPLVQMTSLQRLSIREEQYMSINGLEAVLCNLQQLKCLHVPDLSLEDVEALPKSLQLIHIHHSMEVDTIAALLSFAKSNPQTSITFRILSLEHMTYETAHQLGCLFADIVSASKEVVVRDVVSIKGSYICNQIFGPVMGSYLARNVHYLDFESDPEIIDIKASDMKLFAECCPNVQSESIRLRL